MLLEPDAILAKTYRQALQADGQSVTWVGTAQAAVQKADEHQPDVVVVDIDIARHNGIEFLYEFKSYTEWRDVPVVLLVSSLNHEIADDAVLREQLGIGAVLVRSRLTLKQLCDEVRAVVRVSQ